MTNARAAIAYAFAEQTISNLTITPINTVALITGTLASSTSDGASVNGAGTSKSDDLDVPQTYIGSPPPAPENLFTRYAPGNPPVSPVGNFTRGDAAIPVLQGANNTSSVVAESYLNATGSGIKNEGANGALNASFSFTVNTATALTLTYNFANDIFVYTDGGQHSSADYHFNITVKDGLGNVIFSSATANTNLSLVAPPPGGEVAKTGTESVVTPVLSVLAPGGSYTLIFSTTADSSVSAVPEPSMIAMMGVAGVFGLGYYRRVRRVRSAV